jgi:pyrroloquinoline quinone biosynthesis protein B
VGVIDQGRAWLLDAGPDFRRHLARLKPKQVDLTGILLTHGHIGHYTGLMYLGREAMNTSGLPVWAAPRMAEFIANNGPWDQLVTAGNIDLRQIAIDTPIELSPDVTVNAFSVPHRDEYTETLGYRVAGPDGALIYVPDTDSWDGWERPIEKYIADCNVALLDATFYDRNELPERNISTVAHPLVVDSLDRFGRLSDPDRNKIHFTHLNHTNPLLDRSSAAYIRVVRSGMSVAAAGDEHQL